jgi:hypothetical protein
LIGIEYVAGSAIVVPHSLSGSLESKVPSALRVGEGGLSALLAIDVYELHDHIDRLAGPITAQVRRGSKRPHRRSILMLQPALNPVLIELATHQAFNVER